MSNGRKEELDARWNELRDEWDHIADAYDDAMSNSWFDAAQAITEQLNMIDDEMLEIENELDNIDIVERAEAMTRV